MLSFHKVVFEILDWAEASQTHFMNRHEEALYKNTPTKLESDRASLLSVDREDSVLRLYIQLTYPAYFGLNLRIPRNVLCNGDHVHARYSGDK